MFNFDQIYELRESELLVTKNSKTPNPRTFTKREYYLPFLHHVLYFIMVEAWELRKDKDGINDSRFLYESKENEYFKLDFADETIYLTNVKPGYKQVTIDLKDNLDSLVKIKKACSKIISDLPTKSKQFRGISNISNLWYDVFVLKVMITKLLDEAINSKDLMPVVLGRNAMLTTIIFHLVMDVDIRRSLVNAWSKFENVKVPKTKQQENVELKANDYKYGVIINSTMGSGFYSPNYFMKEQQVRERRDFDMMQFLNDDDQKDVTKLSEEKEKQTIDPKRSWIEQSEEFEKEQQMRQAPVPIKKRVPKQTKEIDEDEYLQL